MEYCPGGELSTHLERAARFSEEVAAFYAAELLLAVQQLHQHGIVHRDIKPENVLLTEDGHLKLVDFGISKFGITQATSGARTICGSYEYLGKISFWRTTGAFSINWGVSILTRQLPRYCEEKNTAQLQIGGRLARCCTNF